MIRIAVSGALGNMGRLTRTAIESAPDLEYAGGFARTPDPQANIYDDLELLFLEQRPAVLFDFTVRPMAQTAAQFAVEHGAHTVCGSSEWNDAEQASLAALCEQHGKAALIVPNFALGAVLMMRFCREVAQHFSGAEIIEMHRADKRDKPSGTAAATARHIAAGGGPAEVPIHSVRLEGLLAHQMVMFGNTGEVLTIRHDSLSRESFAAGIILAARTVSQLQGLHTGLEAVL